mmetsp:Transcript_96499/g.245277  ORF Transcript_96499/g.245277 Transcript_96499/m.245277 type:complete len:221 (+) Transcript_96499:46-708(+)
MLHRGCDPAFLSSPMATPWSILRLWLAWCLTSVGPNSNSQNATSGPRSSLPFLHQRRVHGRFGIFRPFLSNRAFSLVSLCGHLRHLRLKRLPLALDRVHVLDGIGDVSLLEPLPEEHAHKADVVARRKLCCKPPREHLPPFRAPPLSLKDLQLPRGHTNRCDRLAAGGIEAQHGPLQDFALSDPSAPPMQYQLELRKVTNVAARNHCRMPPPNAISHVRV